MSSKKSDIPRGNRKLHQLLSRPGPLSDFLEICERKTGLDRNTIFLIFMAILVLWLVYGYSAQLLCNVIGFIYPAYKSIKALNQENSSKEVRWLTYWVVFSFFHVAEFFSDHLVWWLPLYYLLKCIFLLWCMAPMDNNGSSFMYNRVIRPVYLSHHSEVDNYIGKVAKKASSVLDNVIQNAKEKQQSKH